jgi:crotonobetainyl-CoA:carnitine CoA-transferase CaiB-like acyl-CoA transferase
LAPQPLGAQSIEVLRELDYADGEIEQLLDSGVIRKPQ